jgi:hypothetical protein
MLCQVYGYVVTIQVTIHQSTRPSIPQNSNLQQDRCENLKCQKAMQAWILNAYFRYTEEAPRKCTALPELQGSLQDTHPSHARSWLSLIMPSDVHWCSALRGLQTNECLNEWIPGISTQNCTRITRYPVKCLANLPSVSHISSPSTASKRPLSSRLPWKNKVMSVASAALCRKLLFYSCCSQCSQTRQDIIVKASRNSTVSIRGKMSVRTDPFRRDTSNDIY